MHIQYNAIHDPMTDSVTIYRGAVKLDDLDDSIVWEEYLHIKDFDTQIEGLLDSLFKSSRFIPIVMRVKNTELLDEGDGTVTVFDNIIVSLPKNTPDDYRLQFPESVILGVPNAEYTSVCETNRVKNTQEILALNWDLVTMFTSRIPNAVKEDCALVYIDDTEDSRDLLLAYKSDVPVVLYK